jgi:hypothetical protein
MEVLMTKKMVMWGGVGGGLEEEEEEGEEKEVQQLWQNSRGWLGMQRNSQATRTTLPHARLKDCQCHAHRMQQERP